MASASHHMPTGDHPSRSLARAVPTSTPRQSALRVFNSIPAHCHGVVPVDGDGAAPLLRKGEVAVYEKYEPHIHGDLVDGGLYVIEYQSTPSGMPREMWVKGFLEYRSRLNVSRSIVRVARGAKNPDDWYTMTIQSPPSFAGARGFICSDGPYEQFDLWQKLIGIVVGIYRGAPALVSGVA